MQEKIEKNFLKSFFLNFLYTSSCIGTHYHLISLLRLTCLFQKTDSEQILRSFLIQISPIPRSDHEIRLRPPITRRILAEA